MEISTLRELIIWIGGIIAASIPGIWALLAQRQKDKAEILAQKQKSEAEQKRTDAEAAEKLSQASGKIQDIYQELIIDLRTQFVAQSQECQDKIKVISERVELLLIENIALKEEVVKLKEENILLNKTIEELVQKLKENGEIV